MGNPDNHGIRLVSWDVDGTLFSYYRLAAELFRSRPFTLNELREVWDFHRSIEKQRRRAGCSVIPCEMQRLRGTQCRENKALNAALSRIPPRRSAVALIRQFAAAGVTQVALSDFECSYKLDALGLNEYFARTYSCEDLGFWKPSPVPLTKIQHEFAVLPSEHLHIGDRRDTDGEACSRNGCRFMLIDAFPRLWRQFNFMCNL
jgi:FMN phosphatase YigB (HAD superfamily)